MDYNSCLDDLIFFPRLSQTFLFPDYGMSTPSLFPLSPLLGRAFGSISELFPTPFSFNDGPIFKDEQDLDPAFHAFSFHNTIDAAAVPTLPICPLDPSPEQETVFQPQQLFPDEDKRYTQAEDAIKSCRGLSNPVEELVAVKQEPVTDPVPPQRTSLKRSRPVKEIRDSKSEVKSVESLPTLSHSSRHAISLSPQRIKKGVVTSILRDELSATPQHNKFFEVPTTPSSSPPSSPPSSSVSSSVCPSSSSSRNDSDYEPDTNDDRDYLPEEGRLQKRQKRVTHHHHRQTASPTYDRKSKKTQLQIVLEDLPFTMDDIVFSCGHYHCPFPDCSQSTTSEGDLGRHLESSAHATHRYVCLSAGCLEQFAREDSMKRHHANNRGKHHKAEHERAVRRGFPFRVRISQAATLKEKVMAWARSEGR